MKNSLNPLRSQEDTFAEEAATWFLRMQEGDCSEIDRCAFEAWLAESETHRLEYQQYEALWQNLDQLGSLPKQASRRKHGAVAGIIAGLAIMLFAAQWYVSLGEAISSAVGEHRHLTLPDGTAVDMNTGSRIRVKMSDGLRKITLVRGEVLLNVARDARPFEVHSGEGVLRDIGTTFNVYREDARTIVTVLEGEVQINLENAAILHLHGGQQAGYESNTLSPLSSANVTDVTAWMGGRLVFRDTPLAEVVKQINRYHSRPVELAHEELANLKVSGEFNSADRDGLIQGLKILLSLNSTEHPDSTEISFQP